MEKELKKIVANWKKVRNEWGNSNDEYKISLATGLTCAINEIDALLKK